MQPGDLLVFDSHLMHRSTDNDVDGHPRRDGVPLRAPPGPSTTPRSMQGYTVNDWMPV